jgi:hypothetical protein
MAVTVAVRRRRLRRPACRCDGGPKASHRLVTAP